MELESISPLTAWTPLHDFKQYRYNNIAAQLFLLRQVNAQLTMRCNNTLMNPIKGGSRTIKDTLPQIYLKKFKKILIKYNLLYQEKFISSDSSSFCTWTQFRKRCFASHITTQKPPKFYQELQHLITNNMTQYAWPLPIYDQDTSKPIACPDADLYIQALNSVVTCNSPVSSPLFLPSSLRLEANPSYTALPTTNQAQSTPTPTTGYFWIVLPHPATR